MWLSPGMKHVYDSGLEPVLQVWKWRVQNSNLFWPKFAFSHHQGYLELIGQSNGFLHKVLSVYQCVIALFLSLICHKMRILKPTSAAEASDLFQINIIVREASDLIMGQIVTAVEQSLIAIYAEIARNNSDPAKLDMACTIRLANEIKKREFIKNFRKWCIQPCFAEGQYKTAAAHVQALPQVHLDFQQLKDLWSKASWVLICAKNGEKAPSPLLFPLHEPLNLRATTSLLSVGFFGLQALQFAAQGDDLVGFALVIFLWMVLATSTTFGCSFKRIRARMGSVGRIWPWNDWNLFNWAHKRLELVQLSS